MPEAQFNDAVRDDGDIHTVIFEANRPMHSHPDKIYPGQEPRYQALA